MSVDPYTTALDASPVVKSFTKPAAGAEIAITVPGEVEWELISIRFLLTTSAVAGTRQVFVVFDNGTSVFFTAKVPWTHPISTLFAYNGGRAYGTSVTPLAGEEGSYSLPLIYLLAGWRIRTTTANRGVADQFDSVALLVREKIAESKPRRSRVDAARIPGVADAAFA